MLKKILVSIFIIFCIVFLGYLILPNPTFPLPPPDSKQSQEPADLESPLRQGYFTNYTRAEVISWYMKQLDHSNFFGVKIPTFLQNYPPEEAQTLIRDQTGSTFLQEIVHPFRENIYVNGFKPPTHNDEPIFFIEGQYYRLKIIIKYIPSSPWVRVLSFTSVIVLIYVLYKAWSKSLTDKKHE